MRLRSDQRRTHRKAMAVASAALAATAFIAPSASAAPTPTAQAVTRCASSSVHANYDANIYSGWNSYRVIGYVSKGEDYTCIPGYKLGRRYTACGVSDGNGWLAIRVTINSDNEVWGYSPQGCFSER